MRLSFVCNGDSRTGFGHVARCLSLARLGASLPETVQVSFQGSYSGPTARRIHETLPNAIIRAERQTADVDVAVFDRLGEPDELNSHADDLIAEVAERADRMIYIASGTRLPQLSAQTQCVGYQPGGPEPIPPKLLWGWDYAPVTPELLSHRRTPRDPSRALIALGGCPDDGPLRLAVSALSRFKAISHVDVLVSPVGASGELRAVPHQILHRQSDLPSVGPLLARAGVVITSFGNLTYEALALAAPVCLLAQKMFQLQLARSFDDLGLAVTAGLASELDAEGLAGAIARTRALAPTLMQCGPATVDGFGLQRVADLIFGAMSRE